MNKYHQEILDKIKSASRGQKFDRLPENYSGTKHKYYFLTAGDHRQIARDWVMTHKDITLNDFTEILSSLALGESIDEKEMVGKLLFYFPKLRSQINPRKVELWLEEMEGWEEIDSLSQSVFTEKDMIPNWEKWEGVIRDLVVDKNISRRRGSLVLLTWSVGHSEDSRFADLAFENIDKLKSEKNILITKAISWLLRELIRYHKDRLVIFLADNAESLPKIALRETWRKIKTGKK